MMQFGYKCFQVLYLTNLRTKVLRTLNSIILKDSHKIKSTFSWQFAFNIFLVFCVHTNALTQVCEYDACILTAFVYTSIALNQNVIRFKSIGTMSSRDRDSNETSPTKQIKWCTQQIEVQWLKDPHLKDWLQQDNGNEDCIY